ncbi:hypothetical protein MHYP_G00110770 [Metynnis hypsauchen]
MPQPRRRPTKGAYESSRKAMYNCSYGYHETLYLKPLRVEEDDMGQSSSRAQQSMCLSPTTPMPVSVSGTILDELIYK